MPLEKVLKAFGECDCVKSMKEKSKHDMQRFEEAK